MLAHHTSRVRQQILRLHHCAITWFSNATSSLFPNLTTLYLNNNAIQSSGIDGGPASATQPSLSGLAALPSLMHLYLAENCITDLEGCLPRSSSNESGAFRFMKLETLDLSNNGLRSTRAFFHHGIRDNQTRSTGEPSVTCEEDEFSEVLPVFPSLKTLLLSRNSLATYEDCIGLRHLPALESLDLSDNRKLGEKPKQTAAGTTRSPSSRSIDDLPVPLPSGLHYLRLTGCGITSSLPHYRKRLLVSMPALLYLDESPCFEKERRLAAAWFDGGVDAERRERAAIREEEEATRRRHGEAFDEMVRAAKEEAQHRRACGNGEEKEGAGGYAKDSFVATGYADDDDDDIEEEEEDAHEDGFVVVKSPTEQTAPKMVIPEQSGSSTDNDAVAVSNDAGTTTAAAQTNSPSEGEQGHAADPVDPDAVAVAKRVGVDVFEQAASVARSKTERSSSTDTASTREGMSNTDSSTRRVRELVRHRDVHESLTNSSRPLIWGNAAAALDGEEELSEKHDTAGRGGQDLYRKLWAMARSIPDDGTDASVTTATGHGGGSRDGDEDEEGEDEDLSNPFDRNFTISSVAAPVHDRPPSPRIDADAAVGRGGGGGGGGGGDGGVVSAEHGTMKRREARQGQADGLEAPTTCNCGSQSELYDID